MTRDRTVHVGYTWEDSPDGRDYDFRIEGIVEAFAPARMYGGPDDLGSPPEGGGCEVTNACLMIVHDVSGTRSALSESNRKKIEADFWKWLQGQAAVASGLEEQLRDASAVADAPDEDRLREHYKEARRDLYNA